jgi:hypothetical protein
MFSISKKQGKTLLITGRVVQENTIELNFIDDNTNCLLDGEVFLNNRLVGSTQNGKLILSEENLGLGKANISIRGFTDFCFGRNKGILFFETWEFQNLLEYEGYIVNLKTRLSPRNPRYAEEMQGFVKPEQTTSFLRDVNLENLGVEQAVEKLVSYRIRYRSDILLFNKIEYWQTPNETLVLGHGDCEDWAVTALSLIRAYNNTLQCYNVLWESHLSIFCFFNEDELIKFQSDEDFINWAYWLGI